MSFRVLLSCISNAGALLRLQLKNVQQSVVDFRHLYRSLGENRGGRCNPPLASATAQDDVSDRLMRIYEDGEPSRLFLALTRARQPAGWCLSFSWIKFPSRRKTSERCARARKAKGGSRASPYITKVLTRCFGDTQLASGQCTLFLLHIMDFAPG